MWPVEIGVNVVSEEVEPNSDEFTPISNYTFKFKKEGKEEENSQINIHHTQQMIYKYIRQVM